MPHDLYNENRKGGGAGGERKIVGGKRQVLKKIS